MKKAEEFDGYSCIFCPLKRYTNGKEMIQLYFDKDVVEKAFRTLKGITNLRPIRHWLYDRVHGPCVHLLSFLSPVIHFENEIEKA